MTSFEMNFTEMRDDQDWSFQCSELPVGRVASPDDMAEAYVYLANNGFTTGSVLLIEGGARLV